MIETTTGLSQKLNTELPWAEREAERCQVSERKLIEKLLGEVPLPTKMPRSIASLPKQAAKKKKKKSNIRNTATDRDRYIDTLL